MLLTMLKDIKHLLTFLNKEGVTLKGFITTYLIYKNDDELLYSFIMHDKAMTEEAFAKLVNKGWLKKSKYPSNLKEDEYEIGEHFKRIILKLNDNAEKLWEEYPAFMYINGNKVPCKTMDKEVFKQLFIDKNLGYPKKFEGILQAVETMKQEEIQMKIETFIRSEQWDIINQQYGEY